MPKNMTVKVHDISIDGLPNAEEIVGRIAFIWDGCIVSGWPIEGVTDTYNRTVWEANSDVGRTVQFGSVNYWIEFPVDIASIEYGDLDDDGIEDLDLDNLNPSDIEPVDGVPVLMQGAIVVMVNDEERIARVVDGKLYFED